MGHSGRGTLIHAKTTSNVYSSFPHVSQQYRMIEGHPEESIIISKIQSLHVLTDCKLNSVAVDDAYTITVNLSIDNQIPTYIPYLPYLILSSQAMEPARRFGAWRQIFIRLISLNQLRGSAYIFVVEVPAWRLLLIIGK